MKKINILTLAIAIISIASTCKKVIEAEPYQRPEPSEEITFLKTDRGELPPPPDTPWWTIDTAALNPCEARVWRGLKKMYPIENNDSYWNHDIYAMMEPPATQEQIDRFESLSPYGPPYADSTVLRHRLYSFSYLLFYDTVNLEMICKKQCDDVDSTFFLQTIGHPTLRSENNETANYLYYFKRRWRRGPCPYIFDQGSPYEYRNDIQFFMYASLLKANFSRETGKLVGIAFYP